MAFGGLRGAIAFSLVKMLEERFTLDPNGVKVHLIVHRELFLTTTLLVICLTVFLHGSVTKPLVKLLRIQRNVRNHLLASERFKYRVMEHITPIVEELAGHRESNYFVVSFLKIRNRPCVFTNSEYVFHL